MSDCSDEIMEETKRLFEGVEQNIGYEQLLQLLLKFGVTANSFKLFMMKETHFSEEWIDNACTLLFNRFFGA